VLNGAWVLPKAEEHAALFTELAEAVRTQGGTAAVFTVQATGPVEGEAILARFRVDRGREYGEFAERARGFLAEIDKETRLGKFTFAELEEIEDDFGKLSAWLGKIRARDFFPDEEQREAADTLGRCEAVLRTFAEEVYALEGVTAVPASGPEGDSGSAG
jgi:hypothetical protein